MTVARTTMLVAATAILLAGGSACMKRAPGEAPPRVDIGWPATDPRVKWVGSVDVEDSRKKPSWWARWIDAATVTGPSFVRPFGVAWDGEAIVVADPGIRRIARIESGRFTWSDEGLFEQPIGVATCSDGLVVTDSRAGTVTLLDAGLKPVRVLAEGLGRPTGVACHDGRIVVAETGRHRIVVLEGPERSVFGGRGDAPGEFNFPTFLTTNGKELYVGDTLNFRVQRLDFASGRFLGEFGRLGDGRGDMPRGKAVAVDPEGRVWVSDALLDVVSLYDLEGRLLISIGSSGDGPGQFSFPAGIAIRSDGRVAIADSLNRRLQILRLVPKDEGPGPGDEGAG